MTISTAPAPTGAVHEQSLESQQPPDPPLTRIFLLPPGTLPDSVYVLPGMYVVPSASAVGAAPLSCGSET